MWTYDELDGLRVLRGGATTGRWVVLIPGLIGDVDALDDLASALAPDHRLLSWNPRGLYGSAPARDGDYGFNTWLTDLHDLLVHFEIDDALLVGWSAGGRVAIEASAQWPHRVAGAVSIAGTWGRPFEELLQTVVDPGSSLFALITQASAAVPKGTRLPRWAGGIARSALTTRFLKFFRVTADTTEATRLGELFARSLDNDLSTLLATWRGVSRRGRQPLEASLQRPTLWLAGDHDVLTGVDEARAAATGNFTTFIAVPGGTHFLPLDQPELIRLRVNRFERGLASAPANDSTNPQED